MCWNLFFFFLYVWLYTFLLSAWLSPFSGIAKACKVRGVENCINNQKIVNTSRTWCSEETFSRLYKIYHDSFKIPGDLAHNTNCTLSRVMQTLIGETDSFFLSFFFLLQCSFKLLWNTAHMGNVHPQYNMVEVLSCSYIAIFRVHFVCYSSLL